MVPAHPNVTVTATMFALVARMYVGASSGELYSQAGLMLRKYRSIKNNIVVTLHTHCAYPLAGKA